MSAERSTLIDYAGAPPPAPAPRRMWALPGTVAYLGLGVVFLWLRYRKRGAR